MEVEIEASVEPRRGMVREKRVAVQVDYWKLKKRKKKKTKEKKNGVDRLLGRAGWMEGVKGQKRKSRRENAKAHRI